MEKRKEYLEEIKKNEEALKELKHELHLFNALLEARPNVLQLKRGRELKKKVLNRYDFFIRNRKRSIEFYQKRLNNKNISIEFELKS